VDKRATLGYTSGWLHYMCAKINAKVVPPGEADIELVSICSSREMGLLLKPPKATWPALFRKPGTTGAADQRSAASRAAQILGEKTTTCPGSISGAGLDSIKRYAPGWGSKS
jgi:hypothetical protein